MEKKTVKPSSLSKEDQHAIDESLKDAVTVGNDALPEDDLPEDTALAVPGNKDLSDLYGDDFVNAGTEDVTQRDLNTPTLKLIQENTRDIENKKVGFYFRSDTQEQLETVDVTFVNVVTREMENFKKDGMEDVSIYFGFYAGTKEPFKMFVRGWSQPGHRNLQSQVLMYKNRYRIPMFALTVRLSSEQQKGVAKDGTPYDIRKGIFKILRDPADEGMPMVERDMDRIGFLYDAVKKFKAIQDRVQDDEQA